MSRFQSSYWLLVFVIYFMVHALIRTAMGWKLTAEELQLVRDTQEFAWIYGSEMPLYVWLQSAVFDHFGVSVTTLALVKNGIMLLLCLSIFNLVQRVANASWALAATVSLLFIPQIAWTSQHALSSPVLATLMAATTALAFSSLERRPDLIRYITFGALIGLGALSSIYYLFLPVALILSALTAKPFRGLILNWRFLVTTIVAVGVAGRTYSEYLGVMGIPFDAASIVPTSRDALLGRAIDMYSVLQTALTFSSLLIVGSAMVIYSGLGLKRNITQDALNLRDLLVRTLCLGLILIFALSFVNASFNFDHAAIQPLMFLAAPVAALYLYPVMSPKMHRQAFNVAAIIALAVLLATPAHYSFNENLLVAEAEIAQGSLHFLSGVIE